MKFTAISSVFIYVVTMAFRTDNRHSMRFRVRRQLRKFRASLDGAIDGLFIERGRVAM